MKQNNQNSGFILIWVVLILSFSLGIISMLLKPLVALSQTIWRRQAIVSADFSAEAGINWGLKNAPKIGEHTQVNPMNYSVKLLLVEPDSCKRQRYLILSTGYPDKYFLRYKNGRTISRTLRVLLINGPEQPSKNCPNIKTWYYLPPEWSILK